MTIRPHTADFPAPDLRVRGVAIGIAGNVVRRSARGAAISGGFLAT